ncbi:uroporphyrinogen-III synthase [Campylobacter sp.]|uniref:uroporphyrinogen-III synthase n=1 Tax=Campylobacter sp. TaxID=205 RepID=UPI0026FD12A2|nr:uroporphyrinogen-III synthase [Campylobacter sp.]
MIYLVGSNSFYKGVKTLKLNEISFFKFDVDLSKFEALVITSKNSIKALEFNQTKIDENLQIYAIGEASAKAAKQIGFKKIYIGENSHGKEFASEILPLLKDKKTLYLRAKKTVSNLGGILEEASVDITQIVAYENVCLKVEAELKPQPKSVIIFTAPSAVKNFISNFGWDESYKAVSIGKTTSEELAKFTTAITSEIQSVESCIRLAKTLL